MPRHWIITDIGAGSQKCVCIDNSNFRKSLLPNRGAEPKFLSRPECEATLDELHSPLNRQLAFNGEQDMEVIGHYHEFVQPEFSLGAILVQHTHE